MWNEAGRGRGSISACDWETQGKLLRIFFYGNRGEENSGGKGKGECKHWADDNAPMEGIPTTQECAKEWCSPVWQNLPTYRSLYRFAVVSKPETFCTGLASSPRALSLKATSQHATEALMYSHSWMCWGDGSITSIALMLLLCFPAIISALKSSLKTAKHQTCSLGLSVLRLEDHKKTNCSGSVLSVKINILYPSNDSSKCT